MRPHLDPRTVRTTMLWLGRQLLGTPEEPHRGQVRVAVSGDGRGRTLILRTESPSEATAPPDPASADPFTDRLMCAFLSDVECTILAELSAGPARSRRLIERCRIERSRFFVTATHLRQRGLIVDSGSGYALSDWVSDALKRPDFAAVVGVRPPADAA